MRLQRDISRNTQPPTQPAVALADLRLPRTPTCISLSLSLFTSVHSPAGSQQNAVVAHGGACTPTGPTSYCDCARLHDTAAARDCSWDRMYSYKTSHVCTE